ncbi:MAG: hypothetical protein JWQ98_2399 [Chlorobi bacterium]|nr:hypothetical protein [Chlorobiota bacterium]
MTMRLRILVAALAVALFALFTGGATAHAQGCGTITYVNTTPFQVTLCLFPSPPVPCVTVPPGATIVVPLIAPVVTSGVTSAGGINYTWQPNPFPPPPLWIPSVQLTTIPGPNLCYNVLWDPLTCTVTIQLAGPPPCLNP